MGNTSQRLRGAWVLAVSVLVVLGIAGCTSPIPEGQCLFDSDCAEGLACVGRFCRTRCNSDADCSGGARCRQGDRPGVRVCIPQGTPAPCVYPSDCDAPLVCARDGRCLAQCITGYDCRVNNPHQECRDGRCEIECPAGLADCDGNARNGCETDLNTSLASCGACGNACAARANATVACAGGRCEVACAPGFGDCDGNAANGCEADLTQPANCGACGTVCPPSMPLCQTTGEGSGRMCTAVCLDPTAPTQCGPTCTNTQTDPRNCGVCGTVCAAGPGARAVCAAGVCRIECMDPAARGDCDRDPATGCETELPREPAHCGTCGNACAGGDHAAATCGEGRCGLACEAAFGNCDGEPANGCETDLRAASAHCGMCSMACPPRLNAASACADGRCVLTCAAGFGNCDGDDASGCETDLRAASAHCGRCGNACAPRANAAVACEGGACVARCNAGFADCDGMVANGCEVDTRTTAAHCGRCGNACSAAGGAASCAAGVCGIACAAGRGDCDGEATNGCETDVTANALHCGRCRNACSFPGASAACAAGACVRTECAAGRGDCDGNRANGCETDLNTAVAHCGACGNACAPPNATGACAAGRCGVARCNAGFADCDGDPTNGCEVNLQTSTSHCGACGRPCTITNGAPVCAAGACGIAACNAGYGNCDASVATGCETDLRAAVAHCGMCGARCAPANATGACTGGACGIAACNAGFGDCDRAASNGCETSLATTAAHCGACGRACALANATAVCRGGACAVGACNAGFGDCDGNPANGCETNLATSPGNCGRCGGVCALANAAPACVSGACAVGMCNAGYGDCDRMAANGCETSLNTAVAHCGACGRACALANATPACVSGACAVGMCNAGYGDCDRMAANGCETGLATAVAHCGMCGRACVLPNATAGCAAGACTVVSCNAGFGNCDGNPANGCETDLRTTTAHCGGCGMACAAGTVCSGGRCASICAPPTTFCAGACVDLATSATNCGRCGNVCPTPANARPLCAGGACSGACLAGFGNCNGSLADGCEVDLRVTTAHCGMCGARCAPANATGACAGGACGIAACNAGFGNCDGVVSNGCETNTNVAVAHCGTCGRACSFPNAVSACAMGTCGIASCNTGFGNCNAVLADGCETPTSSTVAHCGGCAMACSANNGSPSCASGACAISCNAGYGNCDGNARANGCEAPLNTVANCGACGNSCARAHVRVPFCATGGVCGIEACDAGWGNCNGSAADGCEIDLNNDYNNCGGCGNSCARQATATGVPQACSAGVCRPVNDRCAGATAINLALGSRINLTATTTNAQDDFPATCGGGGGADVFFSFTLTRRELVYADTYGGASYDTVLSLAGSCTAPLTGSTTPGDILCNDDSGAAGCTTGGQQSVVVALLNPGTYYLVLHGYGAASGNATIHFEHLPVGNGALNRLDFTSTTQFDLTGTTSGAGVLSATCTAASGPENTYWWRSCPNVADTRFQAFTCDGRTPTAFDTVVSLTNGVGTGNACNDDTSFCGTSSTRSFIDTRVPAGAGIHTLVVDGYSSGAAGFYNLYIRYPPIIITRAEPPARPEPPAPRGWSVRLVCEARRGLHPDRRVL